MFKSDKKSSFLSFIKGKPLIKHLLLSVITLILLFFFWLQFLNIYTLHDDYIKVPDYTNVSVEKIDSITLANKLRIVIIDSIFDRNRWN